MDACIIGQVKWFVCSKSPMQHRSTKKISLLPTNMSTSVVYRALRCWSQPLISYMVLFYSKMFPLVNHQGRTQKFKAKNKIQAGANKERILIRRADAKREVIDDWDTGPKNSMKRLPNEGMTRLEHSSNNMQGTEHSTKRLKCHIACIPSLEVRGQRAFVKHSDQSDNGISHMEDLKRGHDHSAIETSLWEQTMKKQMNQ